MIVQPDTLETYAPLDPLAADKTAFFLRRMRMLAQSGRMLVGSRPIQEVATDLVELVRVVMGVDAVVIRRQAGNDLHLLACAGVDSSQLSPTVRADEGIAARLLTTLQPMAIENAAEHPTTSRLHAEALRERSGHFIFHSYAGMALVAGGRSVGVLGIYLTREGRKFSAIDLEHLEVVAFMVAAALANQELFDTLQATNKDLRDQVARREQVERLLTLGAFHDSLTGLPNRAVFFQHLQHCIDRGRRNPVPYHVIHCDLDRFKYVNDSLGHQRGDQVLLSVVTAIRQVLRPGDIVARLAGDEFAILIESVPAGPELDGIIARLQESVSRLHRIEDTLDIYVSLSIGVVTGDERYQGAEEVLRDAEIAMYHSKQHGKATVTYFHPEMHARVSRLFDVEKELRKALDQDELDVEFQPIISAETRRLVGFESLARWNHLVFGNVPPADFINVAEDSGLIFQLGECILRKACECAARWQQACRERDIRPPYVTVNLSAAQLLDPDFLYKVRKVLNTSGLDPRMLSLELTESMLLCRPEEALQRLQDIRTLGPRIVIDDFGTGYSSLSYLDIVPADALKIDQSFVRPIKTSAPAREVVPAIISLAHALGMTVIAEGVETSLQAETLAALGCDFLQGYFVGPPVPADDAVALSSTEGLTMPKKFLG
jgi:diguanylate cyclase (GGDEF)-like protein